MNITTSHIENFEKITNFKLYDLLFNVKEFFSNEYPEIIEFYRGNSKFIKKDNFKKLEILIQECERCTDAFSRNKKSFDKCFYWDILDSMEDIKIKLLTTKNSSKFLRSSIINGKLNSGLVVSVKLEKNQTIEDVAKNVLNSSDPDLDWLEIAIQNDLKESDWDIDGGTQILVRKNIFQRDLVTSFVDNTIGERIYGLDIKREFNFKDEDLETLSYKETLYQTVEILSSLSKGDIPEFRELGIESSIYKGTNYSQLNASSISNQLRKSFDTDDLFKDFEILDMKLEQGDIFLQYQVSTKLNEVLIQNATL